MVLSGCQSFQKNDNEIDEVQVMAFSAKLIALEHALENISEDDKKFGDSEYFAYGISDTDQIHNKAIIKILGKRQPPVVDAVFILVRATLSG